MILTKKLPVLSLILASAILVVGLSQVKSVGLSSNSRSCDALNYNCQAASAIFSKDEAAFDSSIGKGADLIYVLVVASFLEENTFLDKIFPAFSASDSIPTKTFAAKLSQQVTMLAFELHQVIMIMKLELCGSILLNTNTLREGPWLNSNMSSQSLFFQLRLIHLQ